MTPALCKSCGALVGTSGICPGCETSENPAFNACPECGPGPGSCPYCDPALLPDIAAILAPVDPEGDTEPPTSPDGDAA